MNSRSPARRLARSTLVRAQSDDAVELLIYDEIGMWGLSAREFTEVLRGIDASEIHLRINSPGGDVFDGVAMFNALRNHEARIIAHVDGLAGSIATIIALAGDEVRMAPNAFFAIHNAWGLTIGDARAHRESAERLDKINEASIINTYVAKTGQDAKLVRRWMDDETWFSATEARDAGFVDVVEDASAEDAAALVAAASMLASLQDHAPRPYEHVPAGLQPADGAATDPGLTHETVREYQAILRDAGFSHKETATVISGLKKLCLHDAGIPSSLPRDGGSADLAPDAAAALAAVEAMSATLSADSIIRRHMGS